MTVCTQSQWLYQGLQWSTATALADTLERCKQCGLTVDAERLPMLRDIDTVEASCSSASLELAQLWQQIELARFAWQSCMLSIYQVT